MNFKNLIATTLLCLTPLASFADYNCMGKVDRFQVIPGERVYIFSTDIYGSSSGRAICDLNEEWKGVSIASCKSWLEAVTASAQTGEILTVQYKEEGESCTEIASYSKARAPNDIWLQVSDAVANQQ